MPINATALTSDGARMPLVAGNWKMNLTYADAVRLAQLVVDGAPRSWKRRVQVVLCPPFISLRGVTNVISFDRSFVEVGAQDCYWEESGAYTGAIAPGMISDLGCRWCIVGHSERRTLFGETSADVARTCAALIGHNVAPIVCVGEPSDVYDRGETLSFVRDELKASLEGVSDPGSNDLVVAYEPIWAIGSGTVAAPEHAQRVAACIRETVAGLWGDARARTTRILYGGSVKPGNVAAFTGCADIDGVLVGGASLDAGTFLDLIGKAIDA